ncbi:DMT family transporter [Aeromicrobium sp. Leaf350]|uniref:EamA family transporter n=1 Tax=Aeromicrobium sp. Leaf350 TaxID=2876565 RepID=UPI001E432D82|nr:EamA family transporter [Aeromicrobium sp. Leaf350]
MTALTHDDALSGPHGPTASPRLAAGLLLALVSATAFGTSGALARGLIESGWSPAAAVTLRILVAAAVLLVPVAWSLRGRWHTLLQNARLVTAYGVGAVAGAQLCYFQAIARMDVGMALLIEYTAPVAVVVWLWIRRGERPGPLTLAGAVVAALGLVLVLDLLSGGELDPIGVLWALGAMVGAASYFLLSADESSGLPPLALVGGGLVVAGTLLGLACLVGVLPWAATTADVTYTVGTVPWWVPLLALGVIAGAVSYLTGVAAARRLGSRLASFVALTEVLMALVFAALLLDQVPTAVQLLGALAVLTGVVLVKLGEPRPPITPAEGGSLAGALPVAGS